MTLRRLIFWIHLCCGLALAIWVAVVGITGSIVVFQDQITRAQFMKFAGADETRVEAPIDDVVLRVMRRFPEFQPVTITWPNEDCPFFMTYLIRGPRSVEVYANVRTGEIAGTLDPRGGWLGRVHGWHVNLWGGRSGRMANGYASIGLLVLAIAGVVLWLPKKPWRWQWREVHYATGVLSTAFALMFAVTVMYFVWPGFFVREVGDRFGRRVEPIVHNNVDSLIQRLDAQAESARRAVPDAKIHRLQIVFDPNMAVRVTMRRGSAAQFHLVDTVFLDPGSAAVVRIDRYVDRPLGESILAWFSVLHFAAFGGIWSEIAWSIAGLSFPALSVTGVVMWWRRIRKRF